MNAFDRWFTESGCFMPQEGDAGYEGYIERKIAWKAALEWILNDILTEAWNMVDVNDFINEELGEL